MFAFLMHMPRVRDILAAKGNAIYTLEKTKKIDDALSYMVKNKLSSCLAVNKDGTIAGVFTARDFLRFMDRVGKENHAGKSSAFNKTVSDLMTSKDKMIYCSPSDSSRRCREIMFQLRIRNMPVIEDGEVHGILTMKDIADYRFSVTDTGIFFSSSSFSSFFSPLPSF